MQYASLLSKVLWALLLFTSCSGRPSLAERYLARRPDISSELREAIKQQRVTLGMFPDEAHAAAGAFVYMVRADKTRWPDHSPPPQVIFAQREHPDASHIELTFHNKTQFGTTEPVSFTVTFEQGRAIAITRNPKD
jgi:hypothetical protein